MSTLVYDYIYSKYGKRAFQPLPVIFYQDLVDNILEVGSFTPKAGGMDRLGG